MKDSREVRVLRPTKDNMKTPRKTQYMLVNLNPVVLVDTDMGFRHVARLEELGPMEDVPVGERIFRELNVEMFSSRSWDWKINDFIKYNGIVKDEPKPMIGKHDPKPEPVKRKGRPMGWRPEYGSYSDFLKKNGGTL